MIFVLSTESKKSLFAFICRYHLSIHNGITIFRIFAETNHFFIKFENRSFSSFLVGHIDFLIIRIFFKPRRTIGKSCMLSVIPLHRCAGIIAAEFRNDIQCFPLIKALLSGKAILFDRADIIDIRNAFEMGICHTDFLSLIEKRKAISHHHKSCQHFLADFRHFPFRNITAYSSRLIMILDDIRHQSCFLGRLFASHHRIPVRVRIHRLTGIPSLLISSDQMRRKIKYGFKTAVLSDIFLHLFLAKIKKLSYRECLIRRKGFFFHLLKKFMNPLRILEHQRCAAHSVFTVSREILETKIFLNIDNCIQPETGQAFFHPPADHFIDFFPQLRVLPVQIRLFFREHMKIKQILISRKFFPDTASEIGAPVAGRLPVFSFSDIEIFSVFSIRILKCLLKPFMLI